MRGWSIAGVLLAVFLFLYQNEIFLKFLVILSVLFIEHGPLALTSSQASVTTKKSLQSYRICREIFKWWELGQLHSQQTIPLCPPCRSSTSLFSSRCWCQCAPPPPSQKNLFRDVGAALLVHLLVPVIHLQQEKSLGPYGAHQVSVRTTRSEKPGPFRRILMQVLGDWLLKEVPTLEPV